MMNIRTRSWLEIYLVYPLIPFFAEMGVRTLFLRYKVHWWEIPNLSTMMITLSFFCFFIMEDLSRRTTLPSDPEHLVYYKRGIKRFGQFSLVAAMLFGIILVIESVERFAPQAGVHASVGKQLCVMCAAFLFIVVVQTLCINKRFELTL